MSIRRFVVLVLLVLIAGLAQAASVQQLVPASAPHGARVAIIGSGLDAPDLAVAFTGGAGTIVSRSATVAEVIVPTGAISGPVRVTAGGATIGTPSFTLAADPAWTKVVTLA